MDITTFSDELQNRMKKRFDETGEHRLELTTLGATLNLLKELISELKKFIRGYKFASESEEIKFFKEIKPIFLSQYYYHKKLFALRLFDSFKDLRSRHENYALVLKHMERHARRHQAFYEYCLSGSTCLDKHYFTRSLRNASSINHDEMFSTGYDTKLSKMLAFELVKAYINKAVDQTEEARTKSTLTWTATKTDLIELVYALHSVEAFNKGMVNINAIASVVEEMFNVNLGDYYRTFHDMRIRKRSQTPFLDQLREKFSLRLNVV